MIIIVKTPRSLLKVARGISLPWVFCPAGAGLYRAAPDWTFQSLQAEFVNHDEAQGCIQYRRFLIFHLFRELQVSNVN